MGIEKSANENQLGIIQTELNSLREVGKIIATTQDIDKVLIEILKALHNLLRFEYSTISLIDEKSRTIATKNGIWDGRIDIFPKWIKMAQYSIDNEIDIQTDIVRTGKTEIISAWDERFNKEIWDQFNHERLIRVFMPISVKGKVIGTIEAGYDKRRKESITDPEIKTLSAFVNQAAIAIEVAKQIESIKSEQQRAIIAEKHAMLNNIAGFFAHRLYNAGGTIPALARDVKKALMQSGENPKSQAVQYLEMIEKHANRLMEMAALLRLPSGEKSGEQVCNINPLIELVIHKVDLKSGLIELSLNLEPNLPFAKASSEALGEILFNVFTNAIEAMKSRGKLSITSKYLKSSSEISISVSDTGPGITDKIREKLFEQPFTTTKKGGMGFALFSARAYLVDIGGNIYVGDTNSEGTTFIIEIPIVTF